MGSVVCDVYADIMGGECGEEQMAGSLKGALHMWAMFDDEEHNTVEAVMALAEDSIAFVEQEEPSMRTVEIMGKVIEHEADRIEGIFIEHGSEAGHDALSEVVCKAGGVLLGQSCDDKLAGDAMALSAAMMEMHDEDKEYDHADYAKLFFDAYETVGLSLE